MITSPFAGDKLREKDAWHGWGATIKVRQTYDNNLMTECSSMSKESGGNFKLIAQLMFVAAESEHGWDAGCCQTGTTATGATKEEAFEACVEAVLKTLARSQARNPDKAFKNYFGRKRVRVERARYPS